MTIKKLRQIQKYFEKVFIFYLRTNNDDLWWWWFEVKTHGFVRMSRSSAGIWKSCVCIALRCWLAGWCLPQRPTSVSPHRGSQNKCLQIFTLRGHVSRVVSLFSLYSWAPLLSIKHKTHIWHDQVNLVNSTIMNVVYMLNICRPLKRSVNPLNPGIVCLLNIQWPKYNTHIIQYIFIHTWHVSCHVFKPLHWNIWVCELLTPQFASPCCVSAVLVLRSRAFVVTPFMSEVQELRVGWPDVADLGGGMVARWGAGSPTNTVTWTESSSGLDNIRRVCLSQINCESVSSQTGMILLLWREAWQLQVWLGLSYMSL